MEADFRLKKRESIKIIKTFLSFCVCQSLLLPQLFEGWIRGYEYRIDIYAKEQIYHWDNGQNYGRIYTETMGSIMVVSIFLVVIYIYPTIWYICRTSVIDIFVFEASNTFLWYRLFLYVGVMMSNSSLFNLNLFLGVNIQLNLYYNSVL